MTTRYISKKTAYLYNNLAGSSRSMVLIYGDRVSVNGVPDPTSPARIGASFRGKPGYIKQNQLQTSKPLELYFIDVGQGDSTFIITPGGRKILIDGGLNRRALGFLIWLYRLDKPENNVDIDLLVLTHADEDHLDGLVPIVEHPQIRVQNIVHSGITIYQSGIYDRRIGDLDNNEDFLLTWHNQIDELTAGELSQGFHDWHQAVINENCNYNAVNSTTGAIPTGDNQIQIEVLGPRFELLPDGTPVLRWFDSGDDKHSHTINGHSVVLRLNYRDVSVFFSGDLNIEGAEHLLSFPEISSRMSSHILKAPHHGSHEYHTPLFEAIRPQISVISSGDNPDHGHPRANFLAAVGLASRSTEPLLFSTEIAATFVETGDELTSSDPTTLSDVDFAASDANIVARKLFKQTLPGMINVRTDGHSLYAARRVKQGYWWEAYGPIAAAPHPTVF